MLSTLTNFLPKGMDLKSRQAPSDQISNTSDPDKVAGRHRPPTVKVKTIVKKPTTAGTSLKKERSSLRNKEGEGINLSARCPGLVSSDIEQRRRDHLQDVDDGLKANTGRKTATGSSSSSITCSPLSTRTSSLGTTLPSTQPMMYTPPTSNSSRVSFVWRKHDQGSGSDTGGSSDSDMVSEDAKDNRRRPSPISFASENLFTNRGVSHNDDLATKSNGIKSSQSPTTSLIPSPCTRAKYKHKAKDDSDPHFIASVTSKKLLEWAALEEDYGDPEHVLFRRWAREQRVAEWRRYRMTSRFKSESTERSGTSAGPTQEYLVIKLVGAKDTSFLRFERMEEEGTERGAGAGDCGPDDRVTATLKGWPWYDEICESYEFERGRCQPDLLDLFLVAHLVHWTQPYKYREKPSHWFAVLFARCIGWRENLEWNLERMDVSIEKKGFLKAVRRNWGLKASSDERDAEADVRYWSRRLKQTREDWMERFRKVDEEWDRERK